MEMKEDDTQQFGEKCMSVSDHRLCTLRDTPILEVTGLRSRPRGNECHRMEFPQYILY